MEEYIESLNKWAEKSKHILRERNFYPHIAEGIEIVEQSPSKNAVYILKEVVAPHLEAKRKLDEEIILLKALNRAWETADATSCFNKDSLGDKNFNAIIEYSKNCFKEIESLQIKSEILTEQVLLREKARCCLIHINELHRHENYEAPQAIPKLKILTSQINKHLYTKDRAAAETLALCYFFLAKSTHRNTGDSFTTDSYLLASINQYHLKIQQRLERIEEEKTAIAGIKGKLANQISPENEAKLQEEKKKRSLLISKYEKDIESVKLKVAIVEVQRAWNTLSDANYASASHSAHLAMLLLGDSSSSDKLNITQARFIIAIVAVIQADDLNKMKGAIQELKDIRKKLKDELYHPRLKARAENEIIKALITFYGIILSQGNEDSKYNAEDDSSPKGILTEIEARLKERETSKASSWQVTNGILWGRFYLAKAKYEKDYNSAFKNFEKGKSKVENAISLANNFDLGKVRALLTLSIIQIEMAKRTKFLIQQVAYTNSPDPTEKKKKKKDFQPPEAILKEARGNLSEALDLCTKSESAIPRFIEQRCLVYLNLAEISVMMGNDITARNYLTEFHRLNIFDNALFQRKERQILEELEYGLDSSFRITGLDLESLINSDKVRIYDDNVLKLQEFLYKKLHNIMGKPSDGIIADKLGVSRTTIIRWRNDWKKDKEVKSGESKEK